MAFHNREIRQMDANTRDAGSGLPQCRGDALSLSSIRDRLAISSDVLVIAVAISLPWSTSASSILLGLWLILVLPTLEREGLRRVALAPAAAGLPLALWLLAAIGTTWADASWTERLGGLSGFHKLLAIPLLMMQFANSDRGKWVLVGYVGSCAALLILSFVFVQWSLSWQGTRNPGVPVKDYITQSGEFVVCAFALLPLAAGMLRVRPVAGVALGALVILFLINVFYIATGRTALVTMAALTVTLALRRFHWQGVVGVLLASAICLAAVWQTSSYLREQVTNIVGELQRYEAENVRTRAGERIEFWKKSIGFVAAAPIVGNGTGAINNLFRRSSEGQAGVSALATRNPHNETLTVAIQLGLLGVSVLYALWISHLRLFRGDGLIGWFGLAAVVENIVGCLFNSHLSDFTQGWTYVLAVGVVGGMVLKKRSATERSQ
jgi:O-antigen ligase